MAIIYRKTDKVRVKIHDIEVALRPLTFHEKSEISEMIASGNRAGGALEVVKLCLTDIKGISLPDGSDYKLEFEDGKLSKDCLDDLMNLEYNSDLVLVCLNILAGVPKDFIDSSTGKKLEGISIVKEIKPRKKK